MKATIKLIALALAAATLSAQQAGAKSSSGPASGDPAAGNVKQAAKTAPATAADLKAGASLRDSQGVQVGTIASVDGERIVIDTGKDKIGVPLNILGKDDKGLMLSITADQFNQAIAKAHARAQAAAATQAPQQH